MVTQLTSFGAEAEILGQIRQISWDPTEGFTIHDIGLDEVGRVLDALAKGGIDAVRAVCGAHLPGGAPPPTRPNEDVGNGNPLPGGEQVKARQKVRIPLVRGPLPDFVAEAAADAKREANGAGSAAQAPSRAETKAETKAVPPPPPPVAGSARIPEAVSSAGRLREVVEYLMDKEGLKTVPEIVAACKKYGDAPALKIVSNLEERVKKIVDVLAV
jgi:hypothetical protein